MLKNFAILILLLQIFYLPKKSLAIYDPLSVPNNSFGIHILETTELEPASKFINSSGGDWGYVTIPIRANDRDLSKWTKFMEDCSLYHVIPIIRLASFTVEDYWMAPNQYDLIDYSNFLDQLPWPTKNRYVVIYNEPNHKNEWGGFLYPEEYGNVLDKAINIFHQKNEDFFIISAGFDSSAPNGLDSMNEYDYLQAMNNRLPNILSKIDGFSSHSYGNPGFSSYPNIWSPISVANYRFEENYLLSLGGTRPRIFITEAGWHTDYQYYEYAFRNIWTDDNIVAITPFVYSAQDGPFEGFSFVDSNGNLKPFAVILQNLPKTAGKPIIANIPIVKKLVGSNDPFPVIHNTSYIIISLWNGLMHLISKKE